MSVRSSVERLGLMKCDIKRDIGALTRRVITFVTLFGRRITNKDALLCLRIQFRSMSLVNMHENNIAKDCWGQISGRHKVWKMVGQSMDGTMID